MNNEKINKSDEKIIEKVEEKKETNRRRKPKPSYDNLPEEIKEKIQILRNNEKKYLEKSGFTKWKYAFTSSFIFYSGNLYFFYIRKFKEFNMNKAMFFLLLPSIPLGFLYYKVFVNIEDYRNYYQTHIELNKMIKIHIQKKKES